MTRHRWAQMYPQVGTGPIETLHCVNRQSFENERDKIFKQVWLMVGRAEEIAKAGDYKVKRLDFANTSAIIIRGKDNRIRAFHNVCSHRGNKLVVEQGNETFGSSRAAVVSCRFHGWTFDATGRLLSVPKEDNFYPCFDKKDNGLTSIHCEVWAGFIFINLAAEPSQTLTEFLGEYGEIFGDYPYEQMPRAFTYTTELRCNWKIAVDAFAEAYHVDTIHSGTFPGAKAYFEDIRLFRDHRIAALCATFTLPPTATAMLSRSFLKASVADNSSKTGLPERINPGRRQEFVNELSVLFPSVLLHVTKDIWFTHQFWPVTESLTRWEGSYHVREPKTHGELWAMEQAQVIQRNAWLEDTATMEATHEAIASGAKRYMHLQDDEILVRHGYHVIDRYLAAE